MWQRFTEYSRKSIFFAQEEAQNFGEGYVATEHLLLGLLRDENCVAVQLLARLSVDPANVRDLVSKQIAKGKATSQDMTLTPRAKRVIDLAYEEARNLGNDYIGTEHLLLGLIREEKGLAGRVLVACGVDLEQARNETMLMQEQCQQEAPKKASLHQDFKSNYANRSVLQRVRDWALWAQSFEVPEQSSHQAEVERLKLQIEREISSMQQSLLFGLCLELEKGRSLESSENWKKLRLTAEQVKALQEIAPAIQKLLDS